MSIAKLHATMVQLQLAAAGGNETRVREIIVEEVLRLNEGERAVCLRLLRVALAAASHADANLRAPGRWQEVTCAHCGLVFGVLAELAVAGGSWGCPWCASR